MRARDGLQSHGACAFLFLKAWGLAVEQGGFEGVFAASARGVRYGSRCAQERGCGDKVSGST